MNLPKHRATNLTTPTQARCLGDPCADGEHYCPRHHPTVYAELAAKHASAAA